MEQRYTYYDGSDVRNARMERVERLAQWLDARWVIPGTGWRIGLDGILSAMPGIGDTLAAVISAYIVYEAHQLGAPTRLKARMLFNIFVDWFIGNIPLFGDVFDVIWKANLRNADMLREFLAQRGSR